MKKLIIRLFIELYHWQNNNWGEDGQPILSSLLILSGLQFLNIAGLMMIFQNITKIDIYGFFSSNLAIGMIIPIGVLITDYIIVTPIKVTIQQNPPQKKRILWLYVLFTIILLAACVAWIVYINEHEGFVK